MLRYEKKGQLCLQQGKQKPVSRVSASSESLVLLEPTVCCGPGSCYTHVGTCSQERENMQVHRMSVLQGGGLKREGERETDRQTDRGREWKRARLCFPGIKYISLGLGWTSCFFKRTNELPRPWWAFGRFTPSSETDRPQWTSIFPSAHQQSCTREGRGEC